MRLHVLEHGAQYLEATPQQANDIATTWLARAESEGGDLFEQVKRASLFFDPRVPVDNDKGVVLLNRNITEAVVSDLLQ